MPKGNPGVKHGPRSAETCAKISASLKGVLKGIPKSPEHRAKLAAHLRQLNATPEAKARASARSKGVPLREDLRLAMTGVPRTAEVCAKMAAAWARNPARKAALAARNKTEEVRRAASETKMGPLNHAWRGGTKAESLMVRQRAEIKHWRAAVFARDNYTCCLCLRRGGKIEAHHIQPFSTHKELRFDVNNGMTVCKPCHNYITRTHRSLGLFDLKPVPAPDDAGTQRNATADADA